MKQLLYSNDTFVVKGDGCFYFRICRWGLWFAKYAKWPMLFSEREGYIRALKIFPGWRVLMLRPPEKRDGGER